MTFDISAINLLWSLPFIGLLLSIAIFPVLAPEFWHKCDGKISFGWSGLIICSCFAGFGFSLTIHEVLHTVFHHYIPFVILLATLFTMSSGVHLTVRGKASPLLNVLILAIGAVLTNIIGTTGASMLLIRPILTVNKFRRYRTHVVVFFIFIVANIGGSLTPLGDPPLFLGFLEGVSFFWPLKNLWGPALMILIPLLIMFWLVDHYYFMHDEKISDPEHFEGRISLKISGKRNLFFLFLAVFSVLLSGLWIDSGFVHILGVDLLLSDVLRDVVLIVLTVASWQVTPGTIRHYNHFSWSPLIEVSKIFFGIFITIIPVMHMLKAGAQGPFYWLVSFANPEGSPSSFIYFWLTGVLSAFLDNAPTYLVFFYMAGGDVATLMGNLAPILTAISAGAVFMGAMTYIGNAPNFMVKSIAEKAGVKMPSFFMYMVWSSICLLPLFAIMSWIVL